MCTSSKTKIHILQKGYSYEDDEGKYHAAATCTLVLNKNMKIIVDPGGAWQKSLILEKLKEHKLQPEDIDLVIGTHGHSDHIGNLNLFPNKKQIIGFDIHTGDTFELHDFKNGQVYTLLEAELKVFPTPGHMNHDVSLVVYNSEQYGDVAICGDLFECKDDDGIWQEISENIEVQSKNRNFIANMCDHIVPGHGDIFRNDSKILPSPK